MRDLPNFVFAGTSSLSYVGLRGPQAAHPEQPILKHMLCAGTITCQQQAREIQVSRAVASPVKETETATPKKLGFMMPGVGSLRTLGQLESGNAHLIQPCLEPV